MEIICLGLMNLSPASSSSSPVSYGARAISNNIRSFTPSRQFLDGQKRPLSSCFIYPGAKRYTHTHTHKRDTSTEAYTA